MYASTTYIILSPRSCPYTRQNLIVGVILSHIKDLYKKYKWLGCLAIISISVTIQQKVFCDYILFIVQYCHLHFCGLFCH
jgi:hypothetical protein